MSIIYKIKKGDTIEKISRQIYGTENNANDILRANPDISQDLITGSLIVLPFLPSKPSDRLFNIPFNDKNEVALLINNVRFRFWNKIIINRTIDSIDNVEFTAPFEATNQKFRQLIKPFSFANVSVFVGGEIIFKGTMITVAPELTNESKIVTVGCYSLPGVLNDCTPSASSYPLEYSKLGLKDIAEKIVNPFGIGVIFQANQNAIFERVACNADQKVLDFLTKLAKQRNLIITNNEKGELVFWQGVDSGNTVANLIQGQSPLISVTPFFSQQDYYSHITGIQPVVTGTDGSQFTVKNNLLNSAIRPFTFKADDTLGGNIKEAVDAKTGRMFANMVSYEIIVDTWRDYNNNIWQPNTNIFITAPDAMIYNQYEFTIRSIKFERQANQEIATLNVVLVGSFAGVIPESLPWD